MFRIFPLQNRNIAEKDVWGHRYLSRHNRELLQNATRKSPTNTATAAVAALRPPPPSPLMPQTNDYLAMASLARGGDAVAVPGGVGCGSSPPMPPPPGIGVTFAAAAAMPPPSGDVYERRRRLSTSSVARGGEMMPGRAAKRLRVMPHSPSRWPPLFSNPTLGQSMSLVARTFSQGMQFVC